jgi:quercetin dioxygenase-like cupin family protein
MRPGDTVYTPPGIWHWHGAMPDSFMTHLALSDSGVDADVADVEWGEHVSDDEYDTATTSGETERSTR